MIQDIIEKKLQTELQPKYLKVMNESYKHNVPSGSESHFKVVIVSDYFNDKRLIARHRQVNTILAEELAQHIHALAIHTYTEEEWQISLKQNLVPDSPECVGGSKR